MYHVFSLENVKGTLEANNIKYYDFKLENGYKLLVVPTMGRFFGPFKDDKSASMSWINNLLSSEEGYKEFVETNSWNYGGDRLWIAPEFPFFNKERAKFNETYTVQLGIDPAEYSFESDENSFSLTSLLEGEVFESEYPYKKFSAKREVKIAANPLRRLKSFDKLMNGVEYTGFIQTTTVEDLSPEYPMELAIWNLLQLPTGGTYYLPYLGGELDYVDYYTKSGKEILDDFGDHAEIYVRSVAEHKIGLKSAIATGRVGYLRELPEGKYSLVIRNYFNDPSDLNIKEPSDRPGENGCSQFVYMNDQRGDGFTELECAGRTFGGSTERNSDTMVVDYWYYNGEKESLLKIAAILLGIK